MNDTALQPEDWLNLYYFMRLTSAMEERLLSLYRLGKILGGYYTGRGHEAITVGSAYALHKDDVVLPTHRDAGVLLVRGVSIVDIAANHMGKAGGPTRGKENTSHFADLKHGVIGHISPLPDSMPVCAGVALAFKQRREPRVAITYCGEGATARGDFHEALNIAAVLNLPAVFVIENNQFAYSTPTREEYAISRLSDRAAAYGMPGVFVDGSDVLAVHRATAEALARARAGGGPTLVEALTLRVHGHSAADNAEYVPPELRAAWADKDPIVCFQRFLLDQAALDDELEQAIAQRVTREVNEGVEEAEAMPLPLGSVALEGVWAETQPSVREPAS
ncbi:MAG: thiamine pyrophosphate-dependent dehydrogenase E1 component subunit alpha [Chloroflexi bacterium]|nr:thiamine pyrophosphate-dependent dehydrogenase E1 component subunit alpha [Chloroflexota bacterium]MBI3732777.1 thiamine pyrophosphate-dependent dehydrogenase E1 component subunit alpha [Chloroflexota bacterium]